MSKPQAPSAVEVFLRSRHFILCVVLFSVAFLTPNTYFVYFGFMEKFISPWREIASAGVAFLVASGIMIYTVRGNARIASYYAWFEISISAYYYITAVGWEWGLIPAFSFVFMLPISLKNYTHELEIERDLYDREESKINYTDRNAHDAQYVPLTDHLTLKDEFISVDKKLALLIEESKTAITELEEKNKALTGENQLLSHQLESIREQNIINAPKGEDLTANLF